MRDFSSCARAEAGGKATLLAAILATIATPGLGQPAAMPGAASRTGQELVEREREFSRTSVERGMRDAFLQFIDEDGIIFAPGPVPGRRFLADKPDSPGTLQWVPAFAGAASSGDLGFTTGPYVWDSGKERGTGQYLTIWKRQADGSWRFLLDRGIPGPDIGLAAPASAASAAALSEQGVTWVPAATLVEQDGPRPGADIVAEEALLADAAARSAPEALAGRLAGEARLLRIGTPPAVTASAHASLLARSPSVVRYRLAGSGTSRAGDLAYTYGDASWDEGPKAASGHFVRVWQRRASGWAIVLDSLVALPGPPPRS